LLPVADGGDGKAVFGGKLLLGQTGAAANLAYIYSGNVAGMDAAARGWPLAALPVAVL
jgi:hypothetical protein